MIEEIEKWQDRANTSGAMGVAIHLEEMSEWLNSFTVVATSGKTHQTDAAQVILDVEMQLSLLSTLIKEKQVEVKILDRKNFLDAVADQIVTATAAGFCNGMQVSKAVAGVNASNWSKFDDQGEPIYDINGKIKKGPNYRKPNLEGCY